MLILFENFRYYYLGDVLAENNNRTTAHSYYSQSLQLAKKENNNKHVFDAYLALYWNEMIQRKFLEGKLFLDTLNACKNLNPDMNYSLLSARSAYYDTQKEYGKALDAKKNQMSLVSQVKLKVEKFRLYHTISDRYKELNQPDSALYYGNLAIENITDTTYILNYILYENMADIAEKKNDYFTANKFRSKAAEIHEQTIEQEMNTRVLELEKKYNLAKAENKMLKAETKMRIAILFSLFLILFLIFFALYYSKQKTIAALQKKQLETEKKEAEAYALATEASARLIKQQSENQEKILTLYGTFLKQYAEQQQAFNGVIDKLRGQKQHQLADQFNQATKQGYQEFTAITAHLFTVEKLRELLNLQHLPDCLNESDRLILFMLACKAENKHIAALLYTTPASFKARKTQLKRKLTDNIPSYPDSERLLALF